MQLRHDVVTFALKLTCFTLFSMSTRVNKYKGKVFITC